MASDLLDRLDALDRALDALNGTCLVGLSSEEKAEAMRRRVRLRSKLDAFDAGVVDAFESTGEHKPEGHGSSVDWDKHHCRTKGTATVRSRRLAGHAGRRRDRHRVGVRQGGAPP